MGPVPSAAPILLRVFFVLALLHPAVLTTIHAAAQGSDLTYQGRLTAVGTPVTGSYDFEFVLWDAAEDGDQVAGPLNVDAVTVTNGLFSVTLQFGDAAFTGGARWLEVRVRPAGNSDPHTALSPRQPVGAVPYALYALAPAGPEGPTGPPGPKGEPGITDAGLLSLGTLPDARLSANIARQADLDTLQQTLLTRLAESNAVLVAQILSVSNFARGLVPQGLTVASIHQEDSTLIGQGLRNTVGFPAPAWSNGRTEHQPSARSGHSVVWTGQEMLVWGGRIGPGTPLASGGSYRPDTDRWTPISTIAAPAARSAHTAVWNGLETIVWGGFGSSTFLGNGGRYQSALQRWQPVSTAGAPSERAQHLGVWNGSRMVVWGGRNGGGLLDDGALYDPSTDAWSVLSAPNPPTARLGATAVWTGTRLLVWGGEGAAGALNTGAQLLFDEVGEPVSWQAISMIDAPSARSGHTAVWTGSRLLVWGGVRGGTLLGDGASYDPVADLWTPLPSTGAPSARTAHVSVWTGSEMIVWSGLGQAGERADGGAFDPAASTWRSLVNGGIPLARTQAGGVWSGVELLIFGGLANNAPVAALQRVNPQPTWYLYRKP